MEIVKKNILSIICGVIALIALIALAWPVSGMYADQQVVLDGRKKADSENTSLLKAQRYWPVIPDLQSGDKTKLTQFPTDDVIKSGIAIKDYVHEQASKIGDDVAAPNQHQLLVEGTLPNPRELRFDFQRAYLKEVQEPSQMRARLEGTVPPTTDDVHAEADRIWLADFKPKIISVGGQDVNLPQVQDDWLKVCDGLEEKLRVNAARKGKIYLEPNWLTIQKAIAVPGATPKDTEIWYAQMMLWVESDLAEAIQRLNSTAKSVEDATVKHIFELSIPDDQGMYVMNPGAGQGAAPSLTDPPPRIFTVSNTGRVCNPLYDVVQFNLVMNVEASKVPLILTELQRDKLITVVQSDLSAVDGIAAARDGYIYGDVPVVHLSIHGEELFLREWTTKLMPLPIQALLQVPAAPNVPSPAPTPGR